MQQTIMEYSCVCVILSRGFMCNTACNYFRIWAGLSLRISVHDGTSKMSADKEYCCHQPLGQQ